MRLTMLKSLTAFDWLKRVVYPMLVCKGVICNMFGIRVKDEI